ncbi:hypothetical protein AAHA92_11534 [Salvia divinorum]|uniref:Uncharacterized protein n=1 Tax=Salvia divinorum TaxID=28513 RepID=A0ABD1HHT2_SALDI
MNRVQFNKVNGVTSFLSLTAHRSLLSPLSASPCQSRGQPLRSSAQLRGLAVVAATVSGDIVASPRQQVSPGLFAAVAARVCRHCSGLSSLLGRRLALAACGQSACFSSCDANVVQSRYRARIMQICVLNWER